jgi:hypothetical protein
MSDTAAASSSSSSSRTCPTAPRRFQIKVPATSANIGPGFDVVGLSLSLHVVLDVSIDACVPPPPLSRSARRPSAHSGVLESRARI